MLESHIGHTISGGPKNWSPRAAKILFDTSAWLEFLRAKGKQAIKNRRTLTLELGEAATTGPVRCELLAGVDRRAEADVIHLMPPCRDLPF